MARTSSPCHFWCFSFFASGQYTRTAPLTRKRNLSHFLEVLLIEGQLFYNAVLFFYKKTLDIKSALGIIMQIEKILLNIS